jgi:Fic family protein
VYRYKITPETSADLDRIEALRERLDNGAVLSRRWLGRLRRDLEAESVAASTIMEGVRVTVEEVRRVLAADTPPTVTAEDAALVLGYRDAMNYVLRRADEPEFAWHPEVIKAIHDRVMGGSFATRSGRYRTRDVFVSDGSGGSPVYAPPGPAEVPVLVDELSGFLGAAADTPAPVLAALVHARVAGIHPFADGNGRTARVAAALAMYRGGFRSPEFTSLEEWWGSHLVDYHRAFECLGQRWKDKADVTGFVTAHVGAQRAQADALSLRLATQRELWSGAEECVEDLGIDIRAANAVWEAFFGRPITNRYYRGLADVSKVTAASDLARLVAAGLLRQRAAGRDTDYSATRLLYLSVGAALGLDAAAGLEGPDEEMRGLVVSTLAGRLAKRDELTAREWCARYGQAG